MLIEQHTHFEYTFVFFNAVYQYCLIVYEVFQANIPCLLHLYRREVVLDFVCVEEVLSDFIRVSSAGTSYTSNSGACE